MEGNENSQGKNETKYYKYRHLQEADSKKEEENRKESCRAGPLAY